MVDVCNPTSFTGRRTEKPVSRAHKGTREHRPGVSSDDLRAGRRNPARSTDPQPGEHGERRRRATRTPKERRAAEDDAGKAPPETEKGGAGRGGARRRTRSGSAGSQPTHGRAPARIAGVMPWLSRLFVRREPDEDGDAVRHPAVAYSSR
jgi:hypothetical protein